MSTYASTYRGYKIRYNVLGYYWYKGKTKHGPFVSEVRCQEDIDQEIDAEKGNS